MNTKKLTEGKPLKLILLFMIPMLIGNLFQQLYNFTDAIIVSRFIGIKSLAAVGSTVPVIFFFISFIFASTQGFTMITAQRFGAKDYENVRKSLVASIYLSFLLTIVLTLISAPLTENILKFLRTPDDLLVQATQYLFIMLAGIIATVFYNLSSNVIRALGNSKTPLLFLIISVFFNIFLDLLFVIKFHWGIKGAAFATVLAQTLSTILCLTYMFVRFPILHLKKTDLYVSLEFLYEHLKIGVPMGFQMSILSLGIIFVQYALNGLGSTAVAAYTAAAYVDQMFGQSFLALGATMAVYSAQNFGANKIARIKDGVKTSLTIAGIMSLIFYISIKLFSTQIISVFMQNIDNDVMSLAKIYLNTVTLFYIFLATIMIMRNVMQGMGKVFAPLLSGFVELVVRGSVALIFVKYLEFFGVCIAGPSAWISGALTLYICYKISLIKFVRKKK